MAIRTVNKKNHNLTGNQGDKKPIFAKPNDEFDITPEVLSVKKFKNNNGETDHLLTIRVYCLIDVDNINKSQCSKINLSMTKNTAQRLRASGKNNVFKGILRKSIKSNNKNKKDLKSLSFKKTTISKTKKKLLAINIPPSKSSKSLSSATLKPMIYTSLISNQGLLSLKKLVNPLERKTNITNKNQKESKFLAKFNIQSTAVRTPGFLPGTPQRGRSVLKKDVKKVIDVQLNTDSPDVNTALTGLKNELEIYQNSFKNAYNSLISKSIDPIVLFEKSFNKSSFVEKRSSYINIQKFNYSNFYSEYENFFDAIFNLIKEQEVNLYKKNIVVEQQKFKMLETVTTISKSELVNYGPGLNFIYVAEDENGIKLESKNLNVNIQKILIQLQKSSLKYDISSSRKINNNMSVSVGNKSKNSHLNLSVHLKTFKSITDFKNNFFKDTFRNITVAPRKTSIFKNGNFSKIKNPNIKLVKIDENAFFRSTINFSGEEFDNVLSTAAKSSRHSDGNFPDLSITAIQNRSGFVEINVQNMSNNITHILVKKERVFPGRTRGIEKQIYTTVAKLQQRAPLSYRSVVDSDLPINLTDHNLQDGHIYKYYVDCIMKNGEVKRANKQFILKFEERSEIVTISNLATSVVSNNTVVSDESQTRKIKNAFVLRKIETEVDKIYASIFGEVFDLFGDEISKIKDVQSFSYSVMIERINRKTGENIKVGTFQIDSDGVCEFSDNVPIDQDVTYVLKPRVALTADIIASIEGQIDQIGQSQGNAKINFSYASSRRKSNLRRRKVLSSTGTKFNSFSFSKQGKITSPSTKISEESLDFFADRSTGDIFNFEVSSNQNSDRSFDTAITLNDIREIKNLSLSKLQKKENHKSVNISSKRFFNLDFQVNNSDCLFVDFFAILVYENDNAYLDGVAHAKDIVANNSRVRYLVKHVGSVGVVSYYALPVLKDGTVLNPSLIGRNIIE